MLTALRINATTGESELIEIAAPSPIIPNTITMRQARLALLGAGILSQVDAAIAAMPGIEGEAARIEWEYAQDVRRDSPLVTALGPTLNISSSQIDALFLSGSNL